ncbi:hypothetical protein [Azospirillum picis]|uniref:Uncharacterized protein n=1 Tax=Azospirillum picis TaxID=488438 RepID=A0ABU0MP14_9PROT|nr:hypothetical protein [Azospirillum picis]MBP2301382.1 hypothetical protein [Azospirillum picis]MDQ0535213.1 hypothetical protein [Azospirillum picis]
MTTQSQQQQMAQPQQGQAGAGGTAASQQGATGQDDGFCGGACGAGAGAAVIWRPITVETRQR